MTNRTFEEINEDLDHAFAANDSEALLRYAAELDAIETSQAMARASRARGCALFLRGDYSEALSHCHRALALYEELGDRTGVARVTSNIGLVHRSTGDYPAAIGHFHRARALHEELGNHRGVASVTGNIGTVYSNSGDYLLALEHFHRALVMHEELGERRGVASTTGNIGSVYLNTGDYPAALKQMHRSLALYEELGDRIGVAGVTGNIGNVYSQTGNFPEALSHYHRALAQFEELGDRNGVASITGNIGNVHGRTRDYPRALSHLHRAVALHNELGNRHGAASVTHSIGAMHGETGNYPAALEHFHRALALHEELGELSGVASVTGNIVSALIFSEEHAEAEALVLKMDAMQIDDPVIVVRKELSRAKLQQNMGNTDEAVATLHAALEIARAHSIAAEQAEVHKALRDLALKHNDLAGYVEHNNEFTRITEEINGKETTLKMAMQEKQREIDAERKEIDKQLAVLHSTLPKHIADRVARGETVTDHHENAAVIFLDIVGFTFISDRIPSGHVVHLLEQIFTTLDTVCEKHDVVKIKTIGDSYMAVAFDNVRNAASCALDMISSLDTLEITMPPSLGDTSWTKDVGDIKVRIGMHCGPVTAGVIGTQRMQYDVWGDTVNVASRMESSGEAGRIHVSQAFAENLEDESRIKNQESNQEIMQHVIKERGQVDVKGKGLMQTYWLENAQ